MKKLILVLGFLLFGSVANAACPAGTYYTTNGTNCIFVSPTNPLPVDGTFTATVTFPTIGAAVPATGLYNGLNVAGTLRGITGVNPSGSIYAQQIDIASINGAAPSLTNPLWVFPATGAIFPVSGTFWQATQPISAASLPLPALAATSTKQSDGTQKTQIVDSSGNVIGATSNALDVNIKSGFSSTIAVTQSTSPWVVSGTVATNADGSVSGGTAGSKSILGGMQYTGGVGPLAVGNQVAFQSDGDGSLYINLRDWTVAGGTVLGNVGVDQTTPGTSNAVAIKTPAVAPVNSTAAEACHVLKGSAGSLLDLTVTIGATSGYALVFDATSAPGDGAVTPAWWYPILSNGTLGGINKGWPADAPLKFTTGITACFSTTGPFTKTASSSGVALSGQVQ